PLATRYLFASARAAVVSVAGSTPAAANAAASLSDWASRWSKYQSPASNASAVITNTAKTAISIVNAICPDSSLRTRQRPILTRPSAGKGCRVVLLFEPHFRARAHVYRDARKEQEVVRVADRDRHGITAVRARPRRGHIRRGDGQSACTAGRAALHRGYGACPRVAVHGRISRTFPDCIGDGNVFVHRDSHVHDKEQKYHEQWDHQQELERGLSSLAAVKTLQQCSRCHVDTAFVIAIRNSCPRQLNRSCCKSGSQLLAPTVRSPRSTQPPAAQRSARRRACTR